jgi:hypothetical protein
VERLAIRDSQGGRFANYRLGHARAAWVLRRHGSTDPAWVNLALRARLFDGQMQRLKNPDKRRHRPAAPPAEAYPWGLSRLAVGTRAGTDSTPSG